MTGHPALLLAADALTVWAWTRLARLRQPILGRAPVRMILSLVGLALGSLSAVGLSLTVLANWWSGNVGAATDVFNLIATIAVCTAGLGCVFSIVGTGRARLLGVLVCLFAAAAWFAYGASLRSGLW